MAFHIQKNGGGKRRGDGIRELLWVLIDANATAPDLNGPIYIMYSLVVDVNIGA